MLEIRLRSVSFLRMRISVEIDEELVQAAMELTGEKHRSPALAKAVEGFVHRKQAREFGRLIREGRFDYPAPEDPDPANPIPPLAN